MKVFIAGATGVIGQPTVRALTATGHEVRAAARGPEKADLVRSLGVEPVLVDLFDIGPLREAVAASETVVNLATKIPPLAQMRRRSAWRENDRIFSEASRNLVDAAMAAGARVFVQESITFTYEDGGEEWITEDWPVKAATLQSALDAEAESRRFTQYGGRGVVIRFGAFYAPYAPSTADTLRLARRRMFPIIGDGRNYFSSVHVDDAAAAIVGALDAEAGLYNVVDDEPLTMREFGQALVEAFGFPPPRRVPRWLGRLVLGAPAAYLLRSQRVSNGRFKAATGWSPQHPSAREGWRAIADALGKWAV